MKSIQEIKNEVAQSYGMTWGKVIMDRSLFDATVETVAKKYVEEALKESAEKAQAYLDANDNPIVSRGSILSLIKELL